MESGRRKLLKKVPTRKLVAAIKRELKAKIREAKPSKSDKR